MVKDPAAALALPPPSQADEQDYDVLLAALSATARGRAFLAEYARRNRNADTTAVLAALARLEGLIAAKSTAENPSSGAPVGLSRLAVVPQPDEPELPIPTPTAAQRPLITLAHDSLLPPHAPAQPQTGTAAVIPEITWYDAGEAAETDPPLSTPATETQDAAPGLPTAEPGPEADPLAAIMTLTEEERIALFS
jgi:hypothetical protein